MRRLMWLLCLLPMWAACSCDGGGSVSAKGMLVADTLDFKGVFVNTKKEENLLLKNEGRAVVRAWVESAPEGFSLLPTRENPAIIPPAGTLDVAVVFAPTEVKRYDGVLVLNTSGAKNDKLEIQLLGEGLQRDVGVPNVLDFGVVPLNDELTLPLPIVSEAGDSITVSLSIEGTDARSFVAATDEIVLAAGETGEIDITFKPVQAMSHGAVALVRTCTTCEPIRVQLLGQGGEARLVPNPGVLSFGIISPGKSQTLDLRLVNSGNMPVEVSGAAFAQGSDPAFQMDLEVAVGTVEANQALTVPVRFAPAADLVQLGEKDGSLIFYGASGETLFDVPLRGTAGGPDLSVQPNAIDFGVQPLRVKTRRVVTLTNVGNRAPARVEEIFIRGTDSKFTFVSPRGLNFPLEDEPVVIEVFFQSNDIGDYADTLVIKTDDDDSREIQVALTGHAADIPPCDLRINPGQVRLGLVAAGAEHRRDISLFNQGISECAVWDFHMDPNGSSTFRIEGAPEGSAVIAPQESLNLTLVFEPPATVVNQLLTSAIVFSHSTPEDPPKRIEVSGYPSTYQVEIIPNPIDFGPMPIGFNRFLSVSVINTGATAVTVSDFRVEQPDAVGESRFKAVAGAAPDGASGFATIPGPIGAGQRATIRASYLAWFEGTESAELQVFLDGADVPLLVPMYAEGRDEPCGDLCEAPQAVCPPDERVIVNQGHPLPGDAFNAAGDNMFCTWRIVNKPYGSRELPTPVDSCITTFTPDMVGDYVLEMAVVDEQGKYNSCQTKLTAVPHGGLWVEMFWEKASDVDLHLLHPNSDPLVSSNWWTNDDCYYGGRNRAWDGGGDASASLDRDDTQQTGPENIRINRPVIGHRYAVGVHWFRNAGHSTTWVTTNIYCGGVLIGTDTFNLNSNKEFVLVGDIQNNGIAGCTWRPDGTRWIRN